MSIFKRRQSRGARPGGTGLGLADPGHPARQWIDAAAGVGDSAVSLMAAGDQVVMSTNSGAGARLVEAIDAALEHAPEDPDLLVAKSGALCCAMQFKTAEEVLDGVLAAHPDHFEARQRKEHWEKWPHLFIYAPWSEASDTLHPITAQYLQKGLSVQLVRDGLQMGIMVVRPVGASDFPRGLTSDMRGKWEPVWSETPHGSIVAHYLLVEDDPARPYKGESFLATFLPDHPVPASGYWLLQRLSHLGSCFLVLADGDRVLYNRRYTFPESLQATLGTIAERIAGQAAPQDTAATQRAFQWHMNTFDMDRIRF
jgi:hypothetical protein